ncbi:hypothetical protein [Muricoccus radiodurans]|uniref:hypothetical protein n=1 Tax=Muricoccus radiodurans TaxID=2231721 RepID=UPI003CE728D0
MPDSEWPDPARPGVPLHPERDGWHWLQSRQRAEAPRPARWHARPAPNPGGWDEPWLTPKHVAWADHYLGPCLTPEDVAALQDGARRAETRAMIKAADMLDLTVSEIRSATGELQPGVLRAVRAVLAWTQNTIRSKAGEPPAGS